MKKLLLLLAIIATVVSAQDTPVSLNIWDDVQIPGSNSSSISGVRFNLLYGVNQNLTGVDFGLTPFAVNILRGNLNGVQFGLYNQVDGDALGAQLGLVNNAKKIRGLQWGLVNIAQSLYGIQIGLVNLHSGGTGYFEQPPFFPFINWAF